MAYFTLLGRAEAGGPWGIEFGDRDRETVEDERQCYRDGGALAKNLKIIATTTARQAEIDAAVAKLNGEPA